MRTCLGIHLLLVVFLATEAFLPLISQPQSTRFTSGTSILLSSTNYTQEIVKYGRPNHPIRRGARVPSAGDQELASSPSTALQDSSLLSSTRFNEIANLHPSLLRAINEMKLEQMTEIQAQTWSYVLNGTSCVGRGKTGTGKTLSFLLPSIQRLLETRTFLPGRSVGILIIAPTRELVQQIGDEAERLLKYLPKTWTVQSMYGGTQMRRDSIMWAKQKPAILVSTTGRLLDHIRDTRVKGRKFGDAILSDIPIVVLDETDRLVEGFWKDTKTISSQLPRPEKRQTLLFSATLPKRAEKSFDQYLPDDYVKIDCVGNVASGERANSQVKQFFLQLADMDDYVCTLISLLRSAMTENPQQFKLVVFFPTAKLARFFAEYLSVVMGIDPVWEIHSRMSQSSRSRVSSSFRSATSGILLTSDVSARGMDYPDVTCVIQYGAPYSADLYLHRLGRTGRAGKEGAGLQVLLPFESPLQKSFVKQKVPQREINISLDASDQERFERGKHLIGSRHATLTPRAEAAYLSIIAYYQEYARRNISEEEIMDAASKFCRSIGLVHLPPLPEELSNQLRKYRK